jgi:hypothetical protein
VLHAGVVAVAAGGAHALHEHHAAVVRGVDRGALRRHDVDAGADVWPGRCSPKAPAIGPFTGQIMLPDPWRTGRSPAFWRWAAASWRAILLDAAPRST